PAGSPGTSASRGRRMSAPGADFDEGLAAQLAEEAVPLVLQLAHADRLPDPGATVLVVDVDLAGGEPLHDVPAGLGAERGGNLAVLQARDLVAEFGAELVQGEPAQVAAAVAADGVVGGFAGDLGEVGAAGDARAQGVDAGPGLGVAVLALAGADQDVARVELGDLAGVGRAVAHLDQLQQLEAAGAAHRPVDITRLHVADDVGERRRDLVEGTPAEVAAFQRVRAVGVAHRGRGEVHLVAVDQALDAVDLGLAEHDLLRRGAYGQGDEVVRL